MKQDLIKDVVQGMLPYLNNTQSEKLQEVLLYALEKYEVTENQNRLCHIEFSNYCSSFNNVEYKILVAGIVVCVIWLLLIRNYKLLNTEKFNVINSIEKNLPVQPFNDEWEKLKNNKKYTDGTKLEKTLPPLTTL